MANYTKQFVIPLVTSDLTSNAYLVADARQIGVQTSDSNVTIYGSNVDGLAAGSSIADADWSALTLIATAGAYTVEPGLRWLRFESASTVTVNLHTRT